MDIQNKLDALARSKFRSRFHLKEKDKEYIKEKGWETIERHAKDFITKRLAPAHPFNDGHQTPWNGAIQSLSLNMPRQLAAVNACINGII